MPKMKPNRSAKKRFRVTGTGKIMMSHAFKRHILTKKSNKRKKRLSKAAMLSPTDVKNAKLLLGI